MTVQTYVVEADVPFLCGKSTLEQWDLRLNTRNGILETNIEGLRKEFRMVNTGGSHYGIILETKDQSNKEVLYLEDKEEDLTSFRVIRNVHEVNNHKGSD